MADSDIFFAKCECKCATRALRFLGRCSRHGRQQLNCSLLHWSGSLTAAASVDCPTEQSLLDESPGARKSASLKMFDQRIETLSFERITQRAFENGQVFSEIERNVEIESILASSSMSMERIAHQV